MDEERLRSPLWDEATLAGMEAQADEAILAPASGFNSLYREWARRAKVLLHEVRRLRDENERLRARLTNENDT
jgi:hypothetical protein